MIKFIVVLLAALTITSIGAYNIDVVRAHELFTFIVAAVVLMHLMRKGK